MADFAPGLKSSGHKLVWSPQFSAEPDSGKAPQPLCRSDAKHKHAYTIGLKGYNFSELGQKDKAAWPIPKAGRVSPSGKGSKLSSNKAAASSSAR